MNETTYEQVWQERVQRWAYNNGYQQWEADGAIEEAKKDAPPDEEIDYATTLLGPAWEG